MGIVKQFFMNWRSHSFIYALRKFAQYLIGMSEYDDQLQTLHYFNNLFHDCKSIPPASDPELRILQECDAIQLAIFDKICNKYGLNYWLDWGTLLGAVRHEGFIPWDDELDVAMLRDDYNKFLMVYKSEMEKFPFQRGRTKWMGYGFQHYETGIWMDIFPIDNKDDKGNLTYGKESPYKDVFNNAIIFPLRNVKFEKYILKAPNDIDAYLKKKFGNYMELPKDGVLHHGELSGRPPLSKWAGINNIDMNRVKKELLIIYNSL